MSKSKKNEDGGGESTSSSPKQHAKKPGETLLVPETLLKKRHDLDELKSRRAANLLIHPQHNKKIVSKRSTAKIHKPDFYIKQARARRNLAIRYKRVKNKGMHTRATNVVTQKTIDIVVDGSNDGDKIAKKKTFKSNSVDAKVVFVVQIKGIQPLPRNMANILQELRLTQGNVGVFLKYNSKTRQKLHLIEPFILYGILSKRSISDLIRRRGYGISTTTTTNDDKEDNMDDKSEHGSNVERIPLKDNVVIEKALSDKTNGNVICIEDIIHEISTCGKYFDTCTKFLWPFHLSSPKTKFQKQILNNCDTRDDYGDKGEEMEDLIRTML